MTLHHYYWPFKISLQSYDDIFVVISALHLLHCDKNLPSASTWLMMDIFGLADGQSLCWSLLVLQNGPQMVKVHRLRPDQVISLLIPSDVICIPHLERPIFPGIHRNK